MELPKTSCPQGYTEADVLSILTYHHRKEDEFRRWMTGQTMSVCDGTTYSHQDKCYYSTECSGYPFSVRLEQNEKPGGHGPVVYKWDMERFIERKPVVDW